VKGKQSTAAATARAWRSSPAATSPAKPEPPSCSPRRAAPVGASGSVSTGLYLQRRHARRTATRLRWNSGDGEPTLPHPSTVWVHGYMEKLSEKKNGKGEASSAPATVSSISGEVESWRRRIRRMGHQLRSI